MCRYKTSIYLAILFWFLCHFATFAQQRPGLIPIPLNVSAKAGNFTLSDSTLILSPDNSFEANYLKEQLEKYFDVHSQIVKHSAKKNSVIRFMQLQKGGVDREASKKYSLSVSQNEIRVTAETKEEIFYAVQTLIQLLPAAQKKKFEVPCVEITDKPTYEWRGMHLDVCRHFFTKEEVKIYLDLLALYKFNVFHWHLTEDQGWRIEIKKYPELTHTGAWRKGSQVGKYDDQKFDTLRYGGFYSQADIKEIVSYAAQRHITIVPEIEMPGHALAALASYPKYSCTGGPFEVAKGWGIFEDVYCPKEETFKFLEDVLMEVCELFPGKYIHIGGDECPKTRWKSCAHCQALIKKENLKDESELQSYFIKRMEKFLNAKGKQVIGWDEILEGGLAPNAAVMSWRGTEGGIAAAQQKHKVVMTPGKPCYFDHYQGKDISKEPLAIGGFNPLDSVYKYDPMPAQLKPEEKKYILGAQGNVWTEYITSFSQVEYMSVPRMCALAEVLWSDKKNKDYSDFVQRLKANIKLLDKMNVNYAKHFLNETK